MDIAQPSGYQVRTALAVRSVRSAIGYSQEQFAKFIGSSKPTIARIETMETLMSPTLYEQMIMKLRLHGITVDALSREGVSVLFDNDAFTLLQEQLQDDARRRSDRKKK